jgi:hypothetical protein
MNPHTATGYANHWKVRTEGYKSTTTTPHVPRLPQPAQPSTQYRTNTQGSTGRPTTTRQSAQSPAQATSALIQPRNPFAHHPGPSPRQMVTWQPNPSPLTQPRSRTTNQPPTRSPATRHTARANHIPPPHSPNPVQTGAPKARASPCRPWRAPYPHPAYLPTQLHPCNRFASRPSPSSPHQTVTWHRAHIAPQRARAQSLTHAPR